MERRLSIVLCAGGLNIGGRCSSRVYVLGGPTPIIESDMDMKNDMEI